MARTLSAEEHQEIGRRYYTQQQYEKAVEAFTEAIEATVRPTVTQYDQRAAAYEKLPDLNAALKDGRNMIKANKEDIKGYLRTASILQKIDKPEKALDIYKYGMKNVPVSNKNFKILQQLHDSLTRHLSPAESFDPFTALPIELAQTVLSFMSFKQTVNLLRVSKGWKDFIINSPRAWLDLDLSQARKDVSRKFVRDAARYAKFKLQSATFHRFPHKDMIKEIASVCKDLTIMEFKSSFNMKLQTMIEAADCAQNLSKLIINAEITADAALQIMRLRPTLQHVEFNYVAGWPSGFSPNWGGPFPNLHTFAIRNCQMPPHRANLGDLFEKTPSLNSLTICGWEDLGDLDLSTRPLTHAVFQNLRSVQGLPSSLEHLQWKAPFIRRSPTGPFLPRITHFGVDGDKCDILEYLLGAHPDEHGHQRRNVAWSKLQHFALRNPSIPDADEDPDDFFEAAAKTKRIFTDSLISLDLTAHQITDKGIEKLLDKKTIPSLKSLSTINLSRTYVSGAGVKDLIDNLPALKTIIIDDCTRITSRDIISYAEKKGIKVTMKMADIRGGGRGRTVRYG